MGFTLAASILLSLTLAQPESPVELQRRASELRLAARYADAEPLYMKALDNASDAEILMPVLDGLALLHLGLNHIDQARNYSERAVSLESDAGPLTTASSFAVRGVVLRAAHDFEGANAYLRRALALREEYLGLNDSLTLDVRTQIAALREAEGNPLEAIGLYRSVLAGYDGRVDARNASAVMDSLARLLLRQGRKPEAESLLRQAVAHTTQLLGERHPNTSSAQSALGVFLLNQGKAREAEPLLRAALRTDSATLPTNHPRVAASQFNLAALLARLSPASAEARDLLAQCAPTYEKLWGEGDARTVAVLDQYAAVLRASREFALAGELEAKTMRVRVQHALHSR